MSRRNNKPNIWYTVSLISCRAAETFPLLFVYFFDMHDLIALLIERSALLYFSENTEPNGQKILPFLLLPPLTLLRSLRCLDPIQMFFFSTRLWRETSPIVHKKNQSHCAGRASPMHKARTYSFMSRKSCMHTQPLDSYDQIPNSARKVSQHIATMATVFWKITAQKRAC